MTESRRWQYRHTVLTLCTFALFATMVARLAISPVVPAITEEFGVSNAAVGLGLTGMWLAYGLAQYPSGVFADRYGERPVILVAVGGTAVGSLLIAVAPLFPLFVLAAIVLGALAGLHFSVATTLLTRIYDDDVGAAIGLHTLGGTAGGLLAPVLAAWIGVNYGWRPAVAIGTAIAIPVFVLFAWRVRPTEPRRPDEPMAERFALEPVLAVITRPQIAFTVVMAVTITFVWQASTSFLPTFLIEHRGQSAEMAALWFSGFFVVQGLVQVGVGGLSDRYGRDPVTLVCLALAAAGFVSFAVGPGDVAILGGIALAGVGLSAYAAVTARFMDVFTEDERGAAFGLTQSANMVLSSSGSVVTGLFADLFGWAVAFTFLAVLLAGAFCALATNRFLELGY
ncbi:MFS transporter [Natronobeatus ordinarius]|uniref:MFS transporter n=1 Tax=Natronobeatus ordinarius TaxID=2963433 RepID=UPI0020CFD7FF|nr:MFS transporter [Natronobeatus ordinarius]